MSKLIVMLTCNDMTVKNAFEVFESCKDLPAACWGFKDNGISVDEMKKVAKSMKEADKTVFFETMALTEKDCLESAEHAITLGVDYMMGGVFFPSVAKVLHHNGIRYFPYIGDIVDKPMVLMNSTPEEVAAKKGCIKEHGCEGVTLMAYENLKNNPEKCMNVFSGNDDLDCIVAGKVNSKERIMAIRQFGLFGFAIGSSFFNGDFDGDGSFREQVKTILSFMEEQ